MHTSDRTIGEVVAEDYRTAKVFEEHGFDFCCGGQITLAAACAANGIDLASMTQELEAAKTASAERNPDYAAWELPCLIDYIINTHHAYLRKNTGPIVAYAHKVAAVHGASHPETKDIAGVFDKIAADLAAHMQAEEEVFFTTVERAYAARKAGSAPTEKDTGTMKDHLRKLGREHEVIGDAMHTIRRLSHDYALPGDACNTFMLAYRGLKEFEDDLHKHVHLENNILFLKAARL